VVKVFIFLRQGLQIFSDMFFIINYKCYFIMYGVALSSKSQIWVVHVLWCGLGLISDIFFIFLRSSLYISSMWPSTFLRHIFHLSSSMVLTYLKKWSSSFLIYSFNISCDVILIYTQIWPSSCLRYGLCFSSSVCKGAFIYHKICFSLFVCCNLMNITIILSRCMMHF
jgi:hypothetical protein